MEKISRSESQRMLHCIAEGKQGAWEAFCIDFDLAVQGKSFDDVYHKLNDQIKLYTATVASLDAKDQKRLLNRHAPILTTLPLVFRVVCSALLRKGDSARHDYTQPMGPLAAA